MAVPVFEEEKMASLTHSLASLSGLSYLGTSEKSSSIQTSDKRIEASQISIALLERKMSAQVGKGLTCM